MLVVFSDLHFTEAQSSKLGEHTFNQNLPAETYEAYLREINQVALANGVEQVNIVLAGDIFEISRSAIWLRGPDRPYHDNVDVLPGSSHEEIILEILETIGREDKVQQTLALFRSLDDLFDVPVALHYILGNHDRLVNATPAIRGNARELLGLEGGELPLAHQFIFHDDAGQLFSLVRHGHEYDPMNFSLDTHDLKTIPTEFPEDVYGKAPLGDIITVELGSALPAYFLDEYGEEQILASPSLMALYERLMAFDDVRPTSAQLAYLFYTPGVRKRETWAILQPCFQRAINALSDNEIFIEKIRTTSSIKKSQRLLLTGVMGLDILSSGIPYWMVKRLMKKVSKKIKLRSQTKWAKREALIQDPLTGCKCVISGHTHFPEVSLMSAKKGDEKYYINTGTWRDMVPATRKFKGFGKLNAITKVIVFKPEAASALDSARDWSFHYLSGVSYGMHRHI
ncbi:metallophosphoesterase [bacterium]|nr:metallophosphoesterase [bacterium]